MRLRCVASTRGAGRAGPGRGRGQGPAEEASPPSPTGSTTPTPQKSPPPAGNYFRNAQWTPDGTCILTNSADNCLRTFVVPADLLDHDGGEEDEGEVSEEDQAPHHLLHPYAATPSAEPVYAFAAYPFFDLQTPAAALVLSSVREHPLRLANALHPSSPAATYSLVNPTTEAFIAPHSLLYPARLGGTHFLAGADSLICLFDATRPGKDAPVAWLPTIPSKRKKLVGGGVGMKGIVSALALSNDGVLAAGTYSRHVGLYAADGCGDALGTFPLAGSPADRRVGGGGVTQLLWSPCGRYLFVVERMSRGVMVYDVRVTGQQLGWLQGRNALTQQRLHVDLADCQQQTGVASTGCELWAGGVGGDVAVWTRPELAVGGKDPDWTRVVHDDPVSSAALHFAGGVLATCSGQKRPGGLAAGESDEDDAKEGRPRSPDSSLKIWSITGG